MKKSIIELFILITIINAGLYSQQFHPGGLLSEDITKIPFIKKAEPKAILHKLASYVDNSAHLPPVGEQGRNQCVGWAVAYYYKTYQEWQDYGWSVNDPNHIFSPSFMYNLINRGNNNFGAYISDGFKLLIDNGCATIADFPSYSGDYTSWPSEPVFLDAIKYRSDTVYYIATNNNAGIEQLKQLLASGNLAVLGINVYENFQNINNYNNTYCVKEKSGAVLAQHAVALVGYDDDRVTSDGKGAVKLVSSTGTEWGDSGFGWISYQALMDPTITITSPVYATNRRNYSPTLIASVQITTANKYLLNLNFGIGVNSTPKYSKSFFDFAINSIPANNAIPYPINNIDFDLSDGVGYLDTTQINNVFLKTSSTVPGMVNNFSITDLRVPYTTSSTETPKIIQPNDTSVYTNLKLKIVNKIINICSEVALQQGWNIVSIPVKTADMSTVALFPRAVSPVYNFTEKYNIVTTLQNGQGYWVEYPAADTLKVCGNSVNSLSIPLTAGWNLVGGYDKNVNISQVTTSPWGIINSPFYEFNNRYDVPAMMEAGKSYWVRSSGAGVINIGNALAKEANQTFSQVNINPKWIKIIVRDSKGNQSIVYGASEAVNTDGYALPPLPPGGAFDVRWNSNSLVDNLSEGAKDILINSTEYPITLKVEGGDLIINDLTGGKLLSGIVKDGQSLVILNSSIQRLEVMSAITPAAFVLEQNYPNPFNPSTVISWQLAVGSFVILKVYDVLGREVKTLVNEQQTAGIHSVTFNAAGLSDGVYFYRINAGGFVETKKLLIMK